MAQALFVLMGILFISVFRLELLVSIVGTHSFIAHLKYLHAGSDMFCPSVSDLD